MAVPCGHSVLRQVHQWFHVVLGPCTSLCNAVPRCDSNHCELLMPLHAGYDMLQRAWRRLHPEARQLCVEDPQIDFPLDSFLPFIFPPVSVRQDCATADTNLTYAYDGIDQLWVQPARAILLKATEGGIIAA